MDNLKTYELEHKRAEQISLNFRWLLGKMDEIFYATCEESQTGTWQHRVEMATRKSKELAQRLTTQAKSEPAEICPKCGYRTHVNFKHSQIECHICGWIQPGKLLLA